MTERNIIIAKAGGTAGSESVNYKISLPANMVKALGITAEDRAVLVEMEGEKIIIRFFGLLLMPQRFLFAVFRLAERNI